MATSTERLKVFTYRMDRDLEARVLAVGADNGITNKTQALNFLLREGLRAVELRTRGQADGFSPATRPSREARPPREVR